MTLAECLRDPNLFGRFFKGKSWRAWRVFLAALFAEATDAAGLEVYRACTGRTAWPTASFTEAALIVGRRGGKSRILALIAVFLATMRDYAPYLAPGEVATIAVLASDRAQARVIFRFVLGLLQAVPLIKPLIVEHDAETITLSNRVIIEIGTASFRAARGYSYAAVLCDEVAFWRTDEVSANPDIEILRAPSPRPRQHPRLDAPDRLQPLCQARRIVRRLAQALWPRRRPRAGVESRHRDDEFVD
jgi:hypothetical protein